MFLGYFFGYTGAICYNMLTRKLLISKHVIHDEHCFPFVNINYEVSSSYQGFGQPSSISSRLVIVHLDDFSLSQHAAQSSDQSQGASMNLQFDSDGFQSLSTVDSGYSSQPAQVFAQDLLIGFSSSVVIPSNITLHVACPF